MSDELTDTQVEEPEPEAPAPDDPLATVTAERDEYLDLQRFRRTSRTTASGQRATRSAWSRTRTSGSSASSSRCSTTWNGRSRPPSGTRRRSSSRA